MAEYIDREAFLSDTTQRYCINCDSYNGVRCRACWVNDMQGEVDDFPAADVAPVVRCRDCKHITPVEGGLPLCTLHNIARAYNDFCSDGARMDGE